MGKFDSFNKFENEVRNQAIDNFEKSKILQSLSKKALKNAEKGLKDFFEGTDYSSHINDFLSSTYFNAIVTQVDNVVIFSSTEKSDDPFMSEKLKGLLKLTVFGLDKDMMSSVLKSSKFDIFGNDISDSKKRKKIISKILSSDYSGEELLKKVGLLNEQQPKLTAKSINLPKWNGLSTHTNLALNKLGLK